MGRHPKSRSESISVPHDGKHSPSSSFSPSSPRMYGTRNAPHIHISQKLILATTRKSLPANKQSKMALLDLEAEYAKAASLMSEGDGGGGGGSEDSGKSGVSSSSSSSPKSSRRQKKEKKEKGGGEKGDGMIVDMEAAAALEKDKDMESAREAARVALVAAAAAMAEQEALMLASGKKGTSKVRKIDRRRREWRALRNVQSVDGVVGTKTMMGVAAVSTDEDSLLLVGGGEGVLDDVVDLRIGGQALAKLDLSYNHRIFEDNLGDDDLEDHSGSIVVESEEETPAPSPHGSGDDSMNNSNSSAFQLLAALEMEPQFLLMLPSHTNAEFQLQQQQQQQLQQQQLQQQYQQQQYQQYQSMHIVDASSSSPSFHSHGLSRVISNQSEDFFMKLDEANADELESDDSSLDELCSSFLA